MSNIYKQGRQVQRYTNFGVDMMEWADGGYVKHSDYQALLDELEAKDKLLAEQRDIIAKQEKWIKDVEATMIAATDRAEAAEKRIAELERKEQHIERQSVIDGLATSGEPWSDIEEYMQKWDAERAAAAGKGE